MKKKYFLIGIVGLLCTLLQSCSSDEPFGTDGEGVLKMKMVINSTVTRADLDQQNLANSCVIYLSDNKGLIYKYKGIDNVPSSLYLKTGSYVAEAWTGDSVGASWDKKFYRTYQPFTIQRGDVKNLVLNCRIANVVASVNPEPIIDQVLQDYTLTVGHSQASLVFDKSNILDGRGYFMMPSTDKDLEWTIEGKDETGSPFKKTGVIKDVQRAHEYVLNIKYTPESEGEVGGGFISVEVDDQENIIEDTVEITAAPIISGIGFDISEGINGKAGAIGQRSFYIQSLGQIVNMEMMFTDYEKFGLPTSNFDLILADEESMQSLRDSGLTWSINYSTQENYTTAKISVASKILDKLTDGKYTITLKVTDSFGKSRNISVIVNVSNEKIVMIETPASEIKSYSTMLYATVTDESLTNISFRYRKVGSMEWNVVPAEKTRSYTIYAQITSLQPGTQYEYQTIADGYVNPTTLKFTTETVFAIPNAGFEDWFMDGKSLVPNKDANSMFWGTGNGATAGFSGNITTNATDIVHSGQYSARMSSTEINAVIVKKFAAGNIFSGDFLKIDMSNMSADLKFGKAFDGSHPIKLKGWANYRPGIVGKYGGSHVASGATDQGHLYVALCTQQYDVNPGANKLFDKNSSTVLAYGEIIFDNNFGADGQMQEFEILLNYRDAASVARAGYIMVVATSSRYGDFFEGSTESVLYLDDLELVYE